MLRFSARAAPGGKGLNVARGALALGADAVLVAFLPGHTGAAVGAMIAEAGIALRGIPCDGEVRSTAVILEPDGRSTVLNERGATIAAGDWARYEAEVTAALPAHRVLVCSGSLPPGAPDDAYARLTAIAREQGAHGIVDASGPAIAAALAAEPTSSRPTWRRPRRRSAPATATSPSTSRPTRAPARRRRPPGCGSAAPARRWSPPAAAGRGARDAGRRHVAARRRGSRSATRSAPATRCSPALAAALEHDADAAGRDPRRDGRAPRPASRTRSPAGSTPRARTSCSAGSRGGRWRSCSASTWARRPARPRSSTEDGEELAHGRAPTPWRRVPTGAEADPHELLAAAVAAARRRSPACRTAPSSGSASPAWARRGCCWTWSGAPIGPLIAWHDARGEQEAAELAAELGAERFAERTGLPAPDVQRREAPLAAPARARRRRRAVRRLNVAEWIVRGLGGDEQTEWSLASRTGWLDLHARDWWDEALAWSGADASLLPPIALAGHPGRGVRAPRSRARAARSWRSRGTTT